MKSISNTWSKSNQSQRSSWTWNKFRFPKVFESFAVPRCVICVLCKVFSLSLVYRRRVLRHQGTDTPNTHTHKKCSPIYTLRPFPPTNNILKYIKNQTQTKVLHTSLSPIIIFKYSRTLTIFRQIVSNEFGKWRRCRVRPSRKYCHSIGKSCSRDGRLIKMWGYGGEFGWFAWGVWCLS